jgi:hypothetical protein
LEGVENNIRKKRKIYCPVAAQDDSYNCIACCSVHKKVFCVELRCLSPCCHCISVFDWRCFIQQKKDGKIIAIDVCTANGEVFGPHYAGVIWRSAFHRLY